MNTILWMHTQHTHTQHTYIYIDVKAAFAKRIKR